MGTSIVWTDALGTVTLANGYEAPVGRFMGWEPLVEVPGPLSYGLSTGIPYKIMYRTDWGAKFSLRELPNTADVQRGLARLRRHLKSGGRVIVNTGDSAGHTYECSLWPGADVDISGYDAKNRKRSVTLFLKNVADGPMICHHDPLPPGVPFTFSEDFESYADTTALEVVWPFVEVFSPGATSSLNLMDGFGGGQCVEIAKAAGVENNDAMRTHTITGLPAGVGFTATARMWKDWDDRHVADGGEIPDGHNVDGNHVGIVVQHGTSTFAGARTILPAASKNTWVNLSVRHHTDHTGVVTIGVGWTGALSGSMEADRLVRADDVTLTMDSTG